MEKGRTEALPLTPALLADYFVCSIKLVFLVLLPGELQDAAAVLLELLVQNLHISSADFLQPCLRQIGQDLSAEEEAAGVLREIENGNIILHRDKANPGNGDEIGRAHV